MWILVLAIGLLLTTPAEGWAQTRTTADQVRMATPAAGQTVTLIGLQGGRYVPVVLGNGISVVISGGVARIDVSVPAPPPLLPTVTVEERQTFLLLVSGKWGPIKSAKSTIWRNGLLMRPGADYTLDGMDVVPVPGRPWDPEDLVTAIDQVVTVAP